METTRQKEDVALGELSEVVRELCAVLEQNDLLELEVHYGTFRLRLKRGDEVALVPATVDVRPVSPPAAAPAPAAAADKTSTIKSPLAGIFYRAPSPGAPPFVREGDEARVGQTVCIIEAMKLMNEIGSEVHGRVRKILVQNAAVVESGQDLMIVEEI